MSSFLGASLLFILGIISSIFSKLYTCGGHMFYSLKIFAEQLSGGIIICITIIMIMVVVLGQYYLWYNLFITVPVSDELIRSYHWITTNISKHNGIKNTKASFIRLNCHSQVVWNCHNSPIVEGFTIFSVILCRFTRSMAVWLVTVSRYFGIGILIQLNKHQCITLNYASLRVNTHIHIRVHIKELGFLWWFPVIIVSSSKDINKIYHWFINDISIQKHQYFLHYDIYFLSCINYGFKFNKNIKQVCTQTDTLCRLILPLAVCHALYSSFKRIINFPQPFKAFYFIDPASLAKPIMIPTIQQILFGFADVDPSSRSIRRPGFRCVDEHVMDMGISILRVVLSVVYLFFEMIGLNQ